MRNNIDQMKANAIGAGLAASAAKLSLALSIALAFCVPLAGVAQPADPHQLHRGVPVMQDGLRTVAMHTVARIHDAADRLALKAATSVDTGMRRSGKLLAVVRSRAISGSVTSAPAIDDGPVQLRLDARLPDPGARAMPAVAWTPARQLDAFLAQPPVATGPAASPPPQTDEDSLRTGDAQCIATASSVPACVPMTLFRPTFDWWWR